MNWFVHQNNLKHKIESNYKGRGTDFGTFQNEEYNPYQEQQMAITDISRRAAERKTALLESYLNSINRFNSGGWITAQSKFRSTVLEEFCGYLFKDLPVVEELGLGFYKNRIFAGISIDSDGEPRFETKDVDFCISKSVQISFESSTEEIRLPLIAIECKTYVDKTMFNEAQFTAQKLKGGSPRVLVLMLTETNAISIEEIPSQTPIDQVYVLRRSAQAPIDYNTVWEFLNDVKDTLETVRSRTQLVLPGKLLSR